MSLKRLFADKDVENSFIVSDGIKSGVSRRIPLYLFSFVNLGPVNTFVKSLRPWGISLLIIIMIDFLYIESPLD